MMDAPWPIFQAKCHSTPICLPRLSFASLSSFPPDGFTLYFSSHGSYIEIYSSFDQSWELIESFDAFPVTKSAIHGLFLLRSSENEFFLFCVGEFEFGFFTVKLFNDGQTDGKREEGRWEWKRRKFGIFSDWILNAKMLYEQEKEDESSAHKKTKLIVILHFANNWIKMLELKLFEEEIDGNISQPIFTLRLECQTLVTSSFFHGNSWSSLCVFSGTAFGAIHFFRPAIGPQILRTFTGNEGMPFAIRCDSNFHWLFSVGDDRSLRIWDIQTGVKLFNKFGHGARPFALELCESVRMIFTAGMDNYICIWRWTLDEKKMINRLFLERKIDILAATGGGGTIKNVLPLQRIRNGFKLVFTFSLVGSDRGPLFDLSLTVNPAKFDPSVGSKKVNAFAFVRLYGITFLIFLDQHRTLSVQPIGTELGQSDQLFEFVEQIRTHFSDSDGRPMAFRSDMFCFSESTRSLALCAEFGHSLHLAIFGERSFRSIHQENAIQMNQFLWVQPEASKMLLAIAQNGQMVVYRIGAFSDANLQTVSQLHSERKVSKIQVALLVAETSIDLPMAGVFLLGTRAGTLLAFSIQSGKLLMFNRIAHGTNDCEKTVSALRVETIKQSEKMGLKGALISMGRDGIMKRWHFRWEPRKVGENAEEAESFSLELFSVRHLPIEWPCEIISIDNSPSFIIGFHSDEFVVLDFSSLFILSSFRCGGGNRKWQFIVGTEGNNSKNRTFRLAYTCKGFLRLVLLDVVHYCPIRPFFHSDDIVTMTSLEYDRNILLFSGGTDRRMALSLFRPSPQLFASSVFCCLDSSVVHRANLECIHVVDNWHWHNETNGNGMDKLILSVGGRSEICAWKLYFDDEIESKCPPQLHFLSSTNLFCDRANFSDGPPPQDCRLMSVRHLDGPFLAILCSDGALRIVQMLPPSAALRHSPTFSLIANGTFRIPSLAMFTSLEVLKQCKVLVCISTDGHLHAFAFSWPMLQKYSGDSGTGESADIDEKHHSGSRSHWTPLSQLHFSPFLVERCGLSSLATAFSSEVDVILIGSESGRISVLECRPNRKTSQNESKIELVTSGDWHASTVTALRAVPFPSSPSFFPSLITVFSVSLDCRLGLGLYDTYRHELRPLRLFPLGVSDPASLLVLSSLNEPSSSSLDLTPRTFPSLRIDCFISGYGVEHVQLLLEQCDQQK